MDSDEEPTIEDPKDAAWAASQREIVIDYLANQRLEHGGVSLEPRWYLTPYIAVWAVRSKADAGRIGWWAISGDLPTDYTTCTDERDAGDVLISFADLWASVAREMSAGRQPENYKIGKPADARKLSPLIASRAKVLREFGKQIKCGKL